MTIRLNEETALNQRSAIDEASGQAQDLLADVQERLAGSPDPGPVFGVGQEAKSLTWVSRASGLQSGSRGAGGAAQAIIDWIRRGPDHLAGPRTYRCRRTSLRVAAPRSVERRTR